MAEINYLEKLDKELLKTITLAGEEARNMHVKAYLIGGIVRDLILGRKNLDLDIVVEGDAVQLAETLGRRLKMTLKVHEAFQTCTLYASHHARIDFATARREMYPKPGALPIVETARLDADIFRRDFTINALAIAINPDSFGRLIDHYGGLADLEGRQIRVFHEKSFVDDPTRVLRAVRFEQRFGFMIEPSTRQLLQEAVRKRMYKTVKPPRYFNEFRKILTEEDPVPALVRLKELGALNFWRGPLKVEAKALGALGQKMRRARGRKEIGQSGSWLYFLMFLLEDLDKRRVTDILQNIQIKKEFADSIVCAGERTKIYKDLKPSRLSESEVYGLLEGYPVEALEYMRLRCPRKATAERIGRYLGRTRLIRLKMTGEDLKALGVREGKKIGLILRRVLHEKIDRSLRTKHQELKVAKEFLD